MFDPVRDPVLAVVENGTVHEIDAALFDIDRSTWNHAPPRSSWRREESSTWNIRAPACSQLDDGLDASRGMQGIVEGSDREGRPVRSRWSGHAEGCGWARTCLTRGGTRECHRTT